MFERHRINLGKGSLQLHTLRADPDRLDLPLEQQRFLVERIRSAERDSGHTSSRQCPPNVASLGPTAQGSCEGGQAQDQPVNAGP